LNHTVDPEELFSNYVWVTATSKVARDHAQYFYEEIIKRSQNLCNGYVLEVASNDGTFLQPFITNKYTVLGVDPAKNIVEMANAAHIPTVCRFFGIKTADEIVEKYGYAQVIIVRNVLPHVANLHDFVQGLQRCLHEDGLLAIEFHYAKKILDELHYDSIYHEHLCYFTIKSIENLLHQYHLYIEDIIESPISGGSLIIYVRKIPGIETSAVQRYRDVEQESKINDFNSWDNFAKGVHAHRDKLLKMLDDAIRNEVQIVGYGASARSSTLLNYCGINSKYLSGIADQNKLKQNHFTAGTHLLIEDPDKIMGKKPDYIVILAWNFKDEIINKLKNKYHFEGKCILPLPNDPTLIDCHR
jgi:SAM-dependent methyltransferase